jgi:selenocysteine lyase/cysteine desulfurase
MNNENYHNYLAYTLRQLVMDVSTLIPTQNGTLNSINFDNAGTTPPFKSVIREIEKYSPWYKYISDKSEKAKLLSELYEEGRVSIMNFVNADLNNDTVVYTKNTTEAINILSNVICPCPQSCDSKPVIITSYMEHLSDYLPWKYRCDNVLVRLLSDGRLDIEDLEKKLIEYQGRVKLVAITGASNVTGYVTPIDEIARLAHMYGAEFLADSAQLIQHRTIDMNPQDARARIDYIAFSAHKTYAPFFTGALVGNKEILDKGLPLCFGAGITKLATDTEVILKQAPTRYEAGSNNILGSIALSVAIQTMIQTGMGDIRKHESSLLSYAINALKENPKLVLYGDTEYLEDRIPIVSFNVIDKSHEEVAKYLYDGYGIIAKNGYCGADLYVRKLTENSPFDGVARVSMALYNQDFEIDRLIKALEKI